jgi:GNAT superfamily N-acetyltransferase
MIDRPEITRLYSLPAGLETLRTDAAREGFAFIERLVAEWTSGTNTFDRPGECLLGAFADGRLVGIGGLNADPYLPGTNTARVRHVYVLEGWRRKGIGRALVDRLVREARGSFGEVRLRTAHGAAEFYIRCGFSPLDHASASHSLKFTGPDAADHQARWLPESPATAIRQGRG